MGGDDRLEEARRWTESGCRSLNGSPDRPGAGPPNGFLKALDALGDRLAVASGRVGPPVMLDLLSELAARGRLSGLRRQGATSCGGATRLLHSSDGVVAVTLSRPTDVDLVPAMVERRVAGGEDPWDVVAQWVSERSSRDVVDRTRLLSMAASVVGDPCERAPASETPLEVSRSTRPAGPAFVLGRRPRVLDLSSLWAGPLCTRLLGLAGADVVKVESRTRPDGARRGSPALWHHLHAGQRSVALDLATVSDRARLAQLMAAADVVVEASRARALAAWGLEPSRVAGPSVWVSITGYGYAGAEADRVGFGDDVAAGAGLVVHHADGPWFCVDAVADPLAGSVAATLALESLSDGDRVHLDVSMHQVARQFAGRCNDDGPSDDDRLGDDLPISEPTAMPLEVLPRLGAHTVEVVDEWCR